LSDSAGAGVEIDSVDGFFIFADVVPNSPAHKAQIASGDTLIAINDTSVAGYATQKVSRYFIGKQGLKVSCKVKRKIEYLDVTFALSKFYMRSVYYRTIKDTIKIRISAFAGRSCLDSGTTAEMQNVFKDPAINRFVLDLSSTRTGNYTTAIAVLKMFTLAGAPLISIRERFFDTTVNTDTIRERTIICDGSSGVAVYKKGIVYMSGATAGPAEVFIAGLHSARPDIVTGGVRTKGYSRAQIVSPTPDSGAVVVTNAVYATVEGKKIDGVGIEPGR
jgi:carboxyl-terminal processing protease